MAATLTSSSSSSLSSASSSSSVLSTVLPAASADAFPSASFAPRMRLPKDKLLRCMEEVVAENLRFTGIVTNAQETFSGKKWKDLIGDARKRNDPHYILGWVKYLNHLGREMWECYDGVQLKINGVNSLNLQINWTVIKVYFLVLNFFEVSEEGEKKMLSESELAFTPFLEELECEHYNYQSTIVPRGVHPLIEEAIYLLQPFDCEEKESEEELTKLKMKESFDRAEFANKYIKEKDSSEYLRWMVHEASLGLKEAQLACGDFYSAVKNNTVALKWYERSAEQGEARAQYEAGMLYLKTFNNAVKGKYWLNKASTQLDLHAQHALAEQCEEEGDKEGALKWYKSIAKKHMQEKLELYGESSF